MGLFAKLVRAIWYTAIFLIVVFIGSLFFPGTVKESAFGGLAIISLLVVMVTDIFISYDEDSKGGY